jgi:hypothetical protein
MGIARENGYSARVEGFLVAGGHRYRLAKTGGGDLVLSEPCCELLPGTVAELLIIVDGDAVSKPITLPDGIALGQHLARYLKSSSL